MNEEETKKPEVIVGKSALDEFLDEWRGWRSKSKAKKAKKLSARPTDEELFGDQRDIVNAIKRKRKQQTSFMDSGFMLVIKFFVGVVDFFVTMIAWVFSFVFSFKFWALVGVIIYFSDIEITDISKAIGEIKIKEAIEKVEEKAEATFIELKEGLDGIEIEIKKSDGSVIKFGGGDDVDVWRTEDFGTGPVMGWSDDETKTGFEKLDELQQKWEGKLKEKSE
jgi:hypothetical protein